MVLTGLGKYLLTKGELRFVYFVPFDDEIDYNPFLSTSGSLSGSDLEYIIRDQIEATPIREAVTGYRPLNKSGSDNTSAIRPIFTMPQGGQVVPRMKFLEEPTGSIDISQRKVVDVYVGTDFYGNQNQTIVNERGYERFDATEMRFEVGYSQDSFPVDRTLEGFLITVYESGSDGLREITHRHDLKNDLAYNNDIKIIAGGVAGISSGR